MTGVVFRRLESRGPVCTGRSSDDWRGFSKIGVERISVYW